MGTRAFISYSRTDFEYVERLAGHMRASGIDAWFDREIAYSDQWWQQIVEQIRRTDAFVLVMTPALEQSDWVIKEVLLARREGKTIFPLLLSGDGLPLVIDIQHVDVSDGSLPPQDFIDAVGGRRAPRVDSTRSDLRLTAVVRELERQEETLAAADRAVAAGRATCQVHVVRSDALLELARPAEALAAADCALADEPENRTAMLARGRVLVNLDESDAALRIADRLLRVEPESAAAMALRALALIGRGEVNDSLTWSARALKAEPENIDALTARGFALTAEGRHAEAAATADAAIAAHPGKAEGYMAKAFVLLSGGRHAEAQNLVDSLVLIYPDFDQSHAMLAAALFVAGQLGRAEAAARRALELNPGRLDNHIGLANLLARQDRPAEALAVLDRAVDVMAEPPRRQDAWFFALRGQLLRTLKRADESCVAFEKARALDQAGPEAFLGLALLECDAGRLQAGRDLLGAAFDRRRSSELGAEVLYHAERYQADGQVDCALLLADVQLEREGPSSDAHLLRATTLAEADRPEEAMRALDQAERCLPTPLTAEHAWIFRFKGNMLGFTLRRRREGREVLLRARELDPQNADVLRDLALMSVLSGSAEEAVGFVNEALAVDDDEETVELAATLLLGDDKFEETLALLDGAVARWTGSAAVHRMRAICLRRLNRLDEALDAARQQTAVLPATATAERISALEVEATVLRQLGRSNEARRVCDRARELDPAKPGPLILQALLALDAEDAALTREHVQLLQELALDDEASDVIHLAQVLVRVDEFALALALLDRLDTFADSALLAHRLRAIALYKLDQPRPALLALQQAERALPRDPGREFSVVFEDIGDLLRSLGRRQEAKAALQRAATLDPDAAGPLVSLALLALDDGDREQGRTEILRALALDPSGRYAGSAITVGNQLREAGRFAEALEIADRVLASGRFSSAQYLRWKCLDELGRTGDAAAAMAALADEYPDDADIQASTAWVQINDGSLTEALRLARRAADLDPSSARAFGAMATALVQLARGPEALRAADRWVELEATSAFARRTRAQALRAVGRSWEALKEEARALRW